MFHFIDRVALVGAPPSYTRMYHYFPAHLTHPFCYYPPAPQTARYPGTAFIRFNGDTKQGGDAKFNEKKNVFPMTKKTDQFRHFFFTLHTYSYT